MLLTFRLASALCMEHLIVECRFQRKYVKKYTVRLKIVCLKLKNKKDEVNFIWLI